jgi:hypothetical protein
MVLTATLVTSPVSGTLTLNPDGSFVYLANPGFTGTDSFTYYASDGYLNSDTVTVTIYVIGRDYWVYAPMVMRGNP